jgi:hypothetical protein
MKYRCLNPEHTKDAVTTLIALPYCVAPLSDEDFIISVDSRGVCAPEAKHKLRVPDVVHC